MSTLFSALAVGQIKIIVILVGIDVVLGIIAAFMKKDFILGKLAGFMKRGVLVYVFGFAVLVAVEQAFPSLATMVTVAYWLIILALIGSILDNLAKIGVPVPKILRK
jgi:phage-related holin